MKLLSGAIEKVARNRLVMQKNSPEVLLGVGIVGMVGSTVLACRATIKSYEVLAKASVDLKSTEMAALHPDKYSEQDRKKDVALIRIRAGVGIARCYAPAVIIGGMSIAALTRSYTIMNRRSIALTAAYGALEKGFNEYRARVVEKYGEEQDRDFRYGTEQVEIVDEKTNRKKIVKRVSSNEPSIYARFFDQTSSSWSKEPEYNKVFLLCQQSYANDLLLARGHVFLNEVYDMLGIPRSKAGAVVGWILSKEDYVDNWIDFNVFEGKTEQARDFVNGREGAILLDFNVDGVIFDKIDGPTEALSWQRGR